MTSIGRPYQYMQSFRVYWQDTEVMDDGMVVKGNEKEAPDAIIDGILAEADMKTMEIWKQNQTPISHGTGQFSIYYVLERSDTDGRRS